LATSLTGEQIGGMTSPPDVPSQGQRIGDHESGALLPRDDPASPTEKAQIMEFGASIFFTDYSISPAELAVALEERGFDSVWAAEHSHIPVPRRTPPPGVGNYPSATMTSWTRSSL